MLVLTRRVGEKVFLEVGGGIVVELVIVRIDRGKVYLGVVAPKEVPVYRSELLEDKLKDSL